MPKSWIRPTPALLVGVGLTLGACAPSADDIAAPGTTERDSAGIRIVENATPPNEARLGWRLSDEPLVSIGEATGQPEYELFGIEDALRLEDGRVLVANGGAGEVRLYGPDGAYQDTWGRAGEGPGEFTGLTNVSTWPGDSVMAWDFSQNRLTVFDMDGRVARTERLTQGEGMGAGRFEGILPDRSLVTASLLSFNPGETTTGLVRRSREFVRVGPDGARLNSLGHHPDEEYYVRPEVGAILRHPFRRAVHSVVWNDLIVIAPNDTYELHAYDPDGSLRLIVRRTHEPQAVTQADVDAHVAIRLADADADARATLERVFEGLPPVESFPAFSSLIADGVGDLWVAEYFRPEDADAGRVWSVFASDGRMRGRMETPAGLTVYRIGSDYVLGRTVDDLGIERVEVWGLDRSGG